MKAVSRRDALFAMGAASVFFPTSGSGRVQSSEEPRSREREPALPSIDSERIAEKVVGTLRPRSGEKAVVVYDPTYYPELAQAIQAGLHREGVYPVMALSFEPPEVVQAMMKRPEGIKKREEEAVSLLEPVFQKADIFLWLPARVLSPDVRWERLLEGSPARGIHFHWISPLAGRSADEVRMLSQMYERAILETDYSRLSREQDRLIGLLRGQTLHLHSSHGTDLRMKVAQDAWFHKNDGDMSPERARSSRSARDREMELPSGALRFIPDSRSVEGRLALPRVSGPSGLAENVAIDFEGGRAVRFRAEKNEEAFRAIWEAVGGDVDKVGEVVLGTNALLVASLPSGQLPYYGYGAGYLRVSLGDNWESGGTLRSPGSRPLWLFLEKASLKSGSREILREGELLP
jgi:hypothetical protein